MTGGAGTTDVPRNRMERQQRYPGIGRCIYCGAADGPLTDEHIIPDAIGGRLILEGASCNACAAETHAFEGHACDTCRPIRRQLGFPSKTKGRRARERAATEKFILDLDGRRVKVPVGEFPGLFVHLAYPLPGILLGAAIEDRLLTGGIHAIELMPGFGERLNDVREKYRANKVSIVGVDKSNRTDKEDTGRMLAKIAHAYAVAELGPDAFTPALVNIILGRRPFNLPHYVGSQAQTTDEASDLHEIGIDTTGLDGGRYVVVRVRLFASFKGPAHYVVVGDSTPQAA